MQYGLIGEKLGHSFSSLVHARIGDYNYTLKEINKDDLVIEIGPGLGTLTKYLLEKAKKVICIELDSKMITIMHW